MQVFRSGAGRVAAWAWLVFVALNLVDLALHGRDRASLVAAAVLLTGCGLAYALGLRPRVSADETALTVVNPFRTTRLPWNAVTAVRAGRALTVVHDGGRIRCWAVQTSARAGRRAGRRTADPALPEKLAAQVKGRTPVDFAAEQLTRLRAEALRGADGVTGAWSWPALVAVCVPLAALAALLLL